jgi:hypothetical protein
MIMASKAEKFVDDVTAVKNTRPILLDSNGNILAEILDDGNLKLNDTVVIMKDVTSLSQFIIDNYATQK